MLPCLPFHGAPPLSHCGAPKNGKRNTAICEGTANRIVLPVSLQRHLWTFGQDAQGLTNLAAPLLTERLCVQKINFIYFFLFLLGFLLSFLFWGRVQWWHYWIRIPMWTMGQIYSITKVCGILFYFLCCHGHKSRKYRFLLHKSVCMRTPKVC